MAKSILVTGGNAGIGLALCRQLAVNHGAKVYLGSRNAEKGAQALKSITDAHPDVAGNVEVLEIDVSDDSSVKAAAGKLKTGGVTLYALVNNAGIGLQTAASVSVLLNTNFYGPKRVSDAFIELLDPVKGRIVNVSSGSASMYLRNRTPDQQLPYTSPANWDQLMAVVEAEALTAPSSGYGLSKAGLTAYTILQSKLYPNLMCTSLSPGFIDTNLTRGYGARLTPEEGTVSCIKCLFGDVVSGHYYGSDGLRSPLTVCRDPGTPEYQGEDNPDASKYNR